MEIETEARTDEKVHRSEIKNVIQIARKYPIPTLSLASLIVGSIMRWGLDR